MSRRLLIDWGEINRPEKRQRDRETVDIDLDIIFLVFCSNYRTCLLAHWSHPHSFAVGVGPLPRGSSQNGRRTFLPVFTLSWLVFNWISFPVFNTAPTPTSLQLEILSAIQNPWSICYWYISIFNPSMRCYPNPSPPLSIWPLPASKSGYTHLRMPLTVRPRDIRALKVLRSHSIL